MDNDALIDIAMRVLGFLMIGGFLVGAGLFYWSIAKKQGIPFDMLVEGAVRSTMAGDRGNAQIAQFAGALSEPSAAAWPPFARHRGLAWDGRVFHGMHGALRFFVANGSPGAASTQEALAQPWLWHLRIEYPRPLGRGLDAHHPDEAKLAALRSDFEVARLEATLLAQEFKVLFGDGALSVFHYRPPHQVMDFAFEAALALAARVDAVTPR